MTLKTSTLLINDKKVHIEHCGNGEPLIFLHGYFQSVKSWYAYVEDFSEHYHVYLIDLPDHGQSDALADGFSIENTANWFIEIMNQFGFNSVSAIGFSYGGDLLYHVASRYSHRLQSMVTIGALGTWSIHDFPELKETFIYKNAASFEWLVEHHQDKDQLRRLFSDFHAYSIFLANDEMSNIDCPVFIVAGEKDSATPANEIKRLTTHLREFKTWILPNVEHSAHEGENKGEFIRRVLAFLNAV